MKITKEIKIGIVVILTLVGFVFMFNFLKGKNLFVSGKVFYVKYNDVNGLSPSKNVSVNGLRVGQVQSIKIVNDATPIYFIVEISVEKDIPFSKKTVAEIYEPGIMSGPEIRLLLDYGKDVASSGDYLPGRVSGGLFGDVKNQLGPTQVKLDSVLVTMNSTLQGVQKLLNDDNQNSVKNMLNNLNHTISSFDKTANSITGTSDQLNGLIKKNDKNIDQLLQNANQALASANTTMTKFGSTADKLNNLELEKILTNFESASSNLDQLLTKINNGEGSLGALAKDKELYNNLSGASKNLNLLLEDFKTNPNRYVQFSIFGKKAK